MRINLSSPVHFLQWYSYVVIIFLFQLIIIFPLSCIIFNDLYNRIISLDSIQTIPLTTLITPHNYKFEQSVKRYDFSPLPPVIDNGINQLIPLRSTIDYTMDLNLKFYCQHRFYSFTKYKPNMELLDSIKLKIWINDDPQNQLLYKIKVPVICSNKDTSESSLALDHTGYFSRNNDPNIQLTHQAKSLLTPFKYSFMNSYRDKWLNEINIKDKINIPTGAKSVHILLDSTSMFTVPRTDDTSQSVEDHTIVNIMKRLTFETDSYLKFKTIYEQGIRNFMLTHSWITYTVGIIVIHSILSLLFLIAGLYCFYRVLAVNSSNKLE